MDQTTPLASGALGGKARTASHRQHNREVHGNVPSTFRKEDLQAFRAELRLRNPVLVWTLFVFNPVYVGWTVFDYLLVPEHWFFFLKLRLAVAALTSGIAFWVSRKENRHYSWEAVWLLAVIYCVGIAPMLPFAGGANFSRYIMGYIFVIITAGVIPFWPPKWPASAIAVSVGLTATLFLAEWSPDAHPIGDLVSGSFVVITASTLSVIASAFKFNLIKRDYLARLRISEVAERESDARRKLLRTSTELQDALEKLEELDRLKSQFFANISHELRTPLTLILAPLDQLDGEVQQPSKRRQLRVIRKNAERLLGLINDMLDLSRLDAGGLRLNLSEIDIRSVASAVFENAAPAALNKGIEFEVELKPMTEKVWGDAHRLEMVVMNLVSNAIKFTPSGGRILLRVRDIEGGVELQVEDSGPGIPAEDLARVFDRFFQVGGGERRREGGVGIGLALAKELVELHGGWIRVESEPGVSTRFTVFLPFGSEHIRPDAVERRRQFEQVPERRRRGEGELEGSVEAEDDVASEVGGEGGGGVVSVLGEGRRPRILLAEDHADVREFIGTLLEPEFDLVAVATGAEAWRSLNADPPDLVVSDVMMPEMDGTELCRAIKTNERLRTIPVILLTARVGSEATLEAYAHGADDFVAKPFHPRVLMARIRAQIKLRSFAMQLVEQEKMAVVGTLAAGILHEVRNPVNAILNAANLLSRGTLTAEASKELVGVIHEGARRIEGITSALDSHARPADAGGTRPSDVVEGIESTFRLLGHRMAEVGLHVECSTDRLADVPSGPLNQVFLNLADNALRIGAGNIWVDVTDRGESIRIAFSDDGPGVPPEMVDRIFDPFFSGRNDGSGSGLGLYLSRQLIERHGGRLWHEPRAGGGAVFIVELPTVGIGDGSGSRGKQTLN